MKGFFAKTSVEIFAIWAESSLAKLMAPTIVARSAKREKGLRFAKTITKGVVAIVLLTTPRKCVRPIRRSTLKDGQ